MTGGGTNTSTTVQSNQPYKASAAVYDYVSPQALNIAKNSNPFAPSTTSTVVPYAAETKSAMGTLASNANANLNGAGISGAGQDIVSSGGFNDPQQQSMEYYGNVGTNPFDLSGNAAYQAYRSKLASDISTASDIGSAGAGRYGSGAATQAKVGSIADALTEADLAQMGRLDSLNSQRFNAGQTGIGNLQTGYELQQLPTQDLLTVGAMNEDLAGRKLNDKLRIEQERKMAPLRELEWLNAIASGTGNYGTSTSTAQTPGQNPLLSGLGYGLTGLGLLGGF